jgi:hypothetical protein
MPVTVDEIRVAQEFSNCFLFSICKSEKLLFEFANKGSSKNRKASETEIKILENHRMTVC